MINQAIETYGRLDVLMCNAGFVRDRTVFNMTEDEWDDVVRVHMKGHFVPTRWATAYWRERFKETEPAGGRAHHLHRVGGRDVRQRRPAQLLGRQGRHRRARARGGPGDEALRRHLQHDQPPGPHPDDAQHLRRRAAEPARKASSTSTTPPTCRRGSSTSAATRPATSPARPSSCGGDTVALMEGWHRVEPDPQGQGPLDARRARRGPRGALRRPLDRRAQVRAVSRGGIGRSRSSPVAPASLVARATTVP